MGKSTVTHVVISSEAVEAFHERRETPLSEEEKTCIRFYKEQCEKFGTLQGFGHVNGITRLDITMAGCWSANRPNWRMKEDNEDTGNPDHCFEGYGYHGDY